MSDDTNQWDADHYEGSHAYVHEYGADVVGLLDPSPDETVLDVGCGTGHLTSDIADAAADCVGVDSARDMLREARETYPDVSFVLGDARDLPFEAAFDAAFSNAALHWIPGNDQPRVLQSVRDALAPGGRFVAEFGGAGNVRSIGAALTAELDARGYPVRNPWFFPTVGEYATLLEAAGFEVTYATLFDRPTDLDGDEGMRDWITMFATEFLTPVPDDEREDFLAAVEDRLRPDRYDGEGWTADYRRLRFVARA